MVNTPFPYFLATLYASRVKLFAEASEFFSCAVFQLVLRKTLFGVHPSGDQKDGSRTEGAKSKLQGDEKEQNQCVDFCG